MQHIVIGYQGNRGSNAEEAAHLLADTVRTSPQDIISFVPLTTTEKVVAALLDKLISYGVVAVKNSLGGAVSETWRVMEKAAAQKQEIFAVAERVIPIHHYLFTKTPDADVRYIASHEQALRQTAKNRSLSYPDATPIETVDTAYAAEMLACGALSDECGVLCRKNAGEMNGLYLRSNELEDAPSYTTFNLIRRPD